MRKRLTGEGRKTKEGYWSVFAFNELKFEFAVELVFKVSAEIEVRVFHAGFCNYNKILLLLKCVWGASIAYFKTPNHLEYFETTKNA